MGEPERDSAHKAPSQDEVDRLMAPYREQIDRIDRDIMALLGRRARVIAEVADFKRRTGIPGMQRERIERQIAARRAWAEQEGLDPYFIAAWFDRLIAHHSAVEQGQIDAGEPSIREPR